MPIALISVSNKEGIVEFAKNLSDLGYEIISTGGTFDFLKDSGVQNLKKVEEITGFPEIMDGRVKTFHPKIFGGILADRSKKEHLNQAKEQKIPLIDLVVCNLYPFEEILSRKSPPGLARKDSFEVLAGFARGGEVGSQLNQKDEAELIENIDIGGVSLLRAAAKNYQYVTVVCEPADYKEVLCQLSRKSDIDSRLTTHDLLSRFRKNLALKAFQCTANYDEMIANYFNDGKTLSHSLHSGLGQVLNLHFKKLFDLRYGENPHQKASFYAELEIPDLRFGSMTGAEVLHGKQLSFNNILDADSGLALIREFDEPAAAVIKHTNPCGCAVSSAIIEAFKKAYAADALSAFGGIIIINRECTKEIAKAISKVFAEMVIAPSFAKEALSILKQKKNIRLIKLPATSYQPPTKRLKDYKKIIGGILEQDYDNRQITERDLKIVSQKKPTKGRIKDLLFAWKVLKHVKSNAIVIAKDGVSIGIGAGQMSRVDSVDIAVKKGQGHLKGAVVASDGFFPFRDSIDKLAENGIVSIIEPGGSVKDEEIIKAVNEHQISMVFTGIRAFRH